MICMHIDKNHLDQITHAQQASHLCGRRSTLRPRQRPIKFALRTVTRETRSCMQRLHSASGVRVQRPRPRSRVYLSNKSVPFSCYLSHIYCWLKLKRTFNCAGWVPTAATNARIVDSQREDSQSTGQPPLLSVLQHSPSGAKWKTRKWYYLQRNTTLA